MASLTSNGSSGSHVILTGSSGSVVSAGNLILAYTDSTGLGSSSVASFRCDPLSGITCSITHSTFTTCGKVDLINGNVDPSAVVVIEDNVWASTPGTSSLELATYLQTISSGTRSIQRNVFDNRVNSLGGDVIDFTIDHNYFGNSIQVAGTYLATTFNHNLINKPGTIETRLPGNMTGGALLFNTDAANPHGFIMSAHSVSGSGGTTVDGAIAEFYGAAPDGDMFLHGDPGASPIVFTIQNTLFLPNAVGSCSGTGFTATTAANTSIVFNNNTWNGGGNQAIVQQENGAETVDSMQNNIVYRNIITGGETMYKYVQYGDSTPNTCTVCDYNAGHQVDLGSDNGYHAAFSATPGSHDLNVTNPLFADRSRTTVMFDQKYLAKSVGTTWVTSHSYSVGDIASYTDAAYWSGQTVNFRCIQAHTSGSGNKPTATGWLAYWEPATLYWIRQAIGAGTTYTDGAIKCAACKPVQALVNWVRRGYTPQHPRLRKAGYNAADIGAVPMDQIIIHITPSVF